MPRKLIAVVLFVALFVFSACFFIFLSPVMANTISDEFTLALAGDVLLDKGVGAKIKKFGPDYPWQELAPYLQNSDLALINLETSVASGGTPQRGKRYTFRSAPETLQGLVNAGVDGVSLANNHVLDYGPEAWRETLDNLRRFNIPFAGTGENEEASLKPAEFNIKGKKVAFFAFSSIVPPGWAARGGTGGIASTFKPGALCNAIRAARPNYDFMVVSVHWGTERVNYPGKAQKLLGHQLIDAGADLVMGHHPHVLQGAEFYNGKLILYSLGNFIFTNRNRLTQETAVARVKIKERQILEVQFVPAYINSGRTYLQQGRPAQRILMRLSRICAPFGTWVDGEGFLHKR